MARAIVRDNFEVLTRLMGRYGRDARLADVILMEHERGLRGRRVERMTNGESPEPLDAGDIQAIKEGA